MALGGRGFFLQSMYLCTNSSDQYEVWISRSTLSVGNDNDHDKNVMNMNKNSSNNDHDKNVMNRNSSNNDHDHNNNNTLLL